MRGARDTIAAVATPPGRGGIAVVRVSGPRVVEITHTVLGTTLSPRRATLRTFRDRSGEAVDRGLALYLPGPGSYTGEDTLELHGHGGPVVIDTVLGVVLDAGARTARPGEFTERAFLNERLDLSQAEAVADLIDSASREAARGALRSLEGELARRVGALVQQIVDLRVFVEAAIDFPEEEIDFLADSDVVPRVAEIRAQLERTLDAARVGCALHEGLTVVIAGRPNVGKSTLLNRLAGRDAAIVTDVPGTTRDALHEHLHLDGLPLRLVDTAGLRETDGAVERIGVERAWQQVDSADLVLLVVDDASGWTTKDDEISRRIPEARETVLVRNKIDLSGASAGLEENGEPMIVARISAKTGAGIDELKTTLKRSAGYEAPGDGVFTARRRHLEALGAAASALARGAEQISSRGAGELLAEDLREAQRSLGLITGAVTTEDLLSQIFSSFCIGK